MPGTDYTGLAPGVEYFKYSDVSWLGTTTEYQKTLRVFFDSGLRKVTVGDKYGLVDKDGAFAAQPIYDEIEAYYWHLDDTQLKETNQNKQAESIFVDGYVQATRNGKMGLLDSKGKEVIPCNYDAVGLPSEGVSRVIKKLNGVNYLGYWNLEQGREIVAPNKYVIPASFSTSANPAGDSMPGVSMPTVEDGRYPAAFDFFGGYALVPTGKEEVITHESPTFPQRDTRKQTLAYAQIIDKNGKEVLSGGPYPFKIPAGGAAYPQAGPYMVYEQVSTKKLRMISDSGDEIVYNSHLESGIVGPQGVIVPAQYHGGIWGNAATGWYPAGAYMEIIPEQALAITLKCGYDGFKESAAERGVIDFSNKTIIPFSSNGPQDMILRTSIFGYYLEPIYGGWTKFPEQKNRRRIL